MPHISKGGASAAAMVCQPFPRTRLGVSRNNVSSGMKIDARKPYGSKLAAIALPGSSLMTPK